jgi:hypothetical protein
MDPPGFENANGTWEKQEKDSERTRRKDSPWRCPVIAGKSERGLVIGMISITLRPSRRAIDLEEIISEE